MAKEFWAILEKGEDGYWVGEVPALPGCHTQGRTKKELVENLKEAIELYLEVLKEKGEKSRLNIEVQKVVVHA